MAGAAKKKRGGVVVIDRGWKKLLQRVKDIGGKRVHVGVFDGDMAMIAAVHEYGSEKQGIPERSFLRSTLKEKEKELAKAMEKFGQAVISGKQSADTMLDKLGLYASTLVKNKITRGPSIPPELKKRTVERKGSTRALVDTGRLVASITWRIRG